MQKLSHEELVSARLTAEQAAVALRHPITVVLHNIRSLYNVGSIFRTADAFAIERVVLCGYTPSPPRKEISKTALGAELVVPYSVSTSTIDAVRELRSSGYTVLAAEITSHPLYAEDLLPAVFPLAIVMGNELSGVPNEVILECNGAIEIPMYGTKHSLNVAVAAGILLASVVNQFRKNHQ